MKFNTKSSLIVIASIVCLALGFQIVTQKTSTQNQLATPDSEKVAKEQSSSLQLVESIQLCQGISECNCPECAGMAMAAQWTGDQSQGDVQFAAPMGGMYATTEGGYGSGYGGPQDRGEANPRWMLGVDGSNQPFGREPTWKSERMVPWESRSYGEYIGPFRTPHVSEYQLRVSDQLEFVYVLARQRTQQAYELNVGDGVQILSSADTTLNQPDPSSVANQNGLEILPDGSISLQLIGQVRAAGKTVEALQEELNDRYSVYVKKPAIVVQVVKANTRMQDLIESVTATAGQGGQVRAATVSPDGTVQLPLIGSIPAIGLTLDEIGREVDARYRREGLAGVRATPVLVQRAGRFIYVLGEVAEPGRFEMLDPTTVMQAIALAGGNNQGANLRQVIVFRRDANWRLVATRLDRAGALYGRRPQPSDEIWLRHSDIVLIPKSPILRLSEAVDLYLTRTAYAIFPQQGVAFNFDDFQSL